MSSGKHYPKMSAISRTLLLSIRLLFHDPKKLAMISSWVTWQPCPPGSIIQRCPLYQGLRCCRYGCCLTFLRNWP